MDIDRSAGVERGGVLASEPVGGRSRATLFHVYFVFHIIFNIFFPVKLFIYLSIITRLQVPADDYAAERQLVTECINKEGLLMKRTDTEEFIKRLVIVSPAQYAWFNYCYVIMCIMCQ